MRLVILLFIVSSAAKPFLHPLKRGVLLCLWEFSKALCIVKFRLMT